MGIEITLNFRHCRCIRDNEWRDLAETTLLFVRIEPNSYEKYSWKLVLKKKNEKGSIFQTL